MLYCNKSNGVTVYDTSSPYIYLYPLFKCRPHNVIIDLFFWTKKENKYFFGPGDKVINAPKWWTCTRFDDKRNEDDNKYLTSKFHVSHELLSTWWKQTIWHC